MSTPNQQPLGEMVGREVARAAVWGLMLLIVLFAARSMLIQPYASKFNRMMASAVLTATGLEVRNFTSITPAQAALARARMKQTIKEGMDFGFDQWQRRVRQVAADPVLKQDFKEAIQYTAKTWHREARGE
ncbi:hypothetical protein MYX64_07220 [Nitrospinae bacterium AH_259_B05_G02_I21]|nr:hypothetical protein [Nitrospinae bacterium AH_259_B05_G02_I21]MDA2931991.1 hypothetical protein [Nitrospinae bacterium AH-259-F20]